VALVGRPNVGKSSLFNRLIGRPQAIVEDTPGTTRDRNYADTDWNGRVFTLIDTGGLDPTGSDDIVARVRAQAQLAVTEADVVVFVVDAREGLTATDREIAELLRQTDKPIILAANKADSERRRFDAVEFYELGLGEPIPISAHHGTGTGDLLDLMVAHFPPESPVEESHPTRIAIVGRPNVGKSSLLNALLGQERAIVSEKPGTTRDAIDTVMTIPEGTVVLVDTAGIRRRGKIEPGIEKYSVLRALRAIDRADVVLLVLDGVDGITAQDTHIAGFIREAYKGLVLVVNKWDLVKQAGRAGADLPTDEVAAVAAATRRGKPQDMMQLYTTLLRSQFNFVDYAPILFVSARTHQRVDKVIPTALYVQNQRSQRITTSALNQALQVATDATPPPSDRGRQLKIYYGTQSGVNPPTFVFFVNDVRLLHFSYERYLENQLRQQFGFIGSPIRLVFKNRG